MNKYNFLKGVLKNKDIVLIIGGEGLYLKNLKNKVEKLNMEH